MPVLNADGRCGWADDLQFYVISGRWEGENERLLGIEACLQLNEVLPAAGIE